eukprot:TRINITY_DN5444_c0_g3_i2.p1 TRINITY_DN5444_c0_g3~~TRINITY_DN5444_c0_g3_i2.p1  ORF type:complete len:1022 (-),score=169.14 TRINITY_DN5444_c0_g3_i2:113-3178(-)
MSRNGQTRMSQHSFTFGLNLGNQQDQHKMSVWQRCTSQVKWLAQKLVENSVLSFFISLLTLYALFGDDCRLSYTDQPMDFIFDYITMLSMGVFSFEIIICCIGKAGYVGGFYFWLDILSTVTLVMDLQMVAETMFGDEISRTSSEDDLDTGSGGDSAEAARAARLSRAGTKAGRVVRLIRLLKLIRMVRFTKKTDHKMDPGLDWDDDEEQAGAESAISKKLTDKTTRGTIMLVVLIMLGLPFFRVDMYGDNLQNSAQYGANLLYRTWCNGMAKHKANVTGLDREAYMKSQIRQVYEDELVGYVYSHNWFCDIEEVPADQYSTSAAEFMARLFWIGAGPPANNWSSTLLPNASPWTEKKWDSLWRGDYWRHYQCGLPLAAQQALRQPWSDTHSCVQGTVRGVSLIEHVEPRLHCPENLRFNERLVMYPQMRHADECGGTTFMFVFDRRDGVRLEATLNALQTLFICFLLGFGAMGFSSDTNKLVLRPIERMIAKLEKIRANPLEAMNISDAESHRDERMCRSYSTASMKRIGALQDEEEQAQDKAHVRCWKRLRSLCGRKGGGGANGGTPEPMETVVLEKTVVKIGSLLALSFGEVGAEMVARNMKGSDSAHLNAMTPGHVVDAVFALMKLRSFDDTTEVLQEQVMVFVNLVSAVVHSVCNEHSGSPTQSVGESYLLVWRLPQSGFKRQRLADLALVCLWRIIVRIRKAPDYDSFRYHQKLLRRLPGFEVILNCGVHVGWAIEGAVGSEFKIDAAYVGPHVNMATRLERLCRDLRVTFVLSEAHVNLMTPEIREETRLIDSVRTCGSEGEPAGFRTKLYTFDIDSKALEVESTMPPVIASTKAMKLRAKFDRNKSKGQMMAFSKDIHNFFETDLDLELMRAPFTDEFKCKFDMGYANYEAGEWGDATRLLEEASGLLKSGDGPAQMLVRFMGQYGNQAPDGWDGCRDLPISGALGHHMQMPLFGPSGRPAAAALASSTRASRLVSSDVSSATPRGSERCSVSLSRRAPLRISNRSSADGAPN